MKDYVKRKEHLKNYQLVVTNETSIGIIILLGKYQERTIKEMANELKTTEKEIKKSIKILLKGKYIKSLK